MRKFGVECRPTVAELVNVEISRRYGSAIEQSQFSI